MPPNPFQTESDAVEQLEALEFAAGELRALCDDTEHQLLGVERVEAEGEEREQESRQIESMFRDKT